MEANKHPDDTRTIPDAFSGIPWKKPEVVFGAADWLLEAGLFTDYHKNDAVMTVMGADKRIKDAEFIVGLPKENEPGQMLCVVYLNRWHLLFGRKDNLIRKVHERLTQNFQGYMIKVGLKIYKRGRT